jgi:hypothetical protein
MSAQIIEFPIHRVRQVSPVSARKSGQEVLPQVRPSIRFARRLIGWGILLVTSYILFFGQSSSVQPAEATNASVTSAMSKNYTYVSVQSGDSLWGIAERYSTGGDIRDFIQEIVALNNLQDSVVEAGMRLAIPRS